MVIRNSVRYLMNRLMFGSECIYHEENCIIDHVTKRATDVNRIEKKSVLKLILSSIEFMVTQCQVVIIYSILLWKNINRGKRLIMKENLIDVVVPAVPGREEKEVTVVHHLLETCLGLPLPLLQEARAPPPGT